MDEKLQAKLGMKHVDLISIACVAEEDTPIQINVFVTDNDARSWVEEMRQAGNQSFARMDTGLLANNTKYIADKKLAIDLRREELKLLTRNLIVEMTSALMLSAIGGAGLFGVLALLQAIPTN